MSVSGRSASDVAALGKTSSSSCGNHRFATAYLSTRAFKARSSNHAPHRINNKSNCSACSVLSLMVSRVLKLLDAMRDSTYC